MIIKDREGLERALRAQLPNGSADSGDKARVFVAEGWIVSTQHGRFLLASGEMWTEPRSRSVLRWLHGFVFVGDWVRSWELLQETEREQLIVGAREVIEDWTRLFGSRSTSHPMAYHDETTALRLRSLTAVYLSPLGTRLDGLLRPLIDTTANVLAQEDFHAGLNNHGMFQDGALLTYGGMTLLEGNPRLPESENAWNRIIQYAKVIFGADGVHREHSPVYHLLISRKLAEYSKLAAAMGLPRSDELVGILNRAAKFAIHATTPRSSFAPLGDTGRETIKKAMVSTYSSPEFAWAVTHVDGTPPRDRIAVFEPSGYAAFRTSWMDRNAMYLMVANAYHGSYHKHSDELNVYLEVAGVPVLDDAGPYGYDYGDPLVSYAYSSHAHNTLLVDGIGLERHDGAMEKTWLEDLGSTSEQLRVKALTSRFNGVFASRVVEASGDSLDSVRVRIQDEVVSDNSHRYTYLWHFGPMLTPVLRGSVVELYLDDSKIAEVAVSSDSAVRLKILKGKSGKKPQALQFPKMGSVEEANVLQVDLFEETATITTEIRLGNFVLRDRGVIPGGEWLTSEGSIPLRYRLESESESSPDTLTVVFSSLRESGDFTHDYRTALNGTNTARLFILDDFGVQGAYYYSNVRETAIFRSVQALISESAEFLGFRPSQITTVGSSKGGAAALIHGYAARAGRIVIGAPQTLIGNFTANHHPEVLRYMAGGTGAGDQAWANEIIPDLLRDASSETRVSILVGGDDHHLQGHVRPFARLAGELGKPISVATIPNLSHRDIGTVFRDFVRTSAPSKSEITVPHVLRYDSDACELVLAFGDLLRGRTAACYLYCDGEVVEKSAYADDPVRTWRVELNHEYYVRVFLRDGEQQLPSFNSSSIVPVRENVMSG